MNKQQSRVRRGDRQQESVAPTIPAGIRVPIDSQLLKKGQRIEAGDLALIKDNWVPVNEGGDPWHPAVHWPMARPAGTDMVDMKVPRRTKRRSGKAKHRHTETQVV